MSGHAARPSAVLVHGMWSRLATWGETPRVLAAAGIRVQPYELPQHGNRHTSAQALGRLGVGDYVDDLAGFVGGLGVPPVLVGHSMGALVSLLAATRVPVAGVLMVTPAVPAGSLPLSWSNLACLARPALSLLLGQPAFRLSRMEAAFGLYNRVPPPQRAALIAQLQPESCQALAEIALWFADRRRATHLDPALVPCPVRAYLGGRDRIVPSHAQRALRGLRDLHITLEPDAGHMVFDEPARERFFGWLSATLAELGCSGPQTSSLQTPEAAAVA